MNKPLLLSLAAATILGVNLNAQSVYERIQSMELQMKQMQSELTTLKATKSTVAKADSEDEDAVASDDEDADDDGVAADDDGGDEDAVASDDGADDNADDGDDDDEESVKDQLADIQESITDLNKATNGSHLKLRVDYRFALDNMQYEMADGSKKSNDAFMTNRLWINMSWKATDNLSFSGQLAYNKAFGERRYSGTGYNFETFDWVTNENAYDDRLRIRSAYFLYKNDTFMGTNVPWTFSIGRRPSTNGHLINLRDDDGASSPMGHAINVEFDGMSSKFALEDVVGVDGMYIKFCAGRGLTNASQKFSPAPYATDKTSNPDIDLMGFIFVPYDNGHYGFATEYYYANNLIDQQFAINNNQPTPTNNFDTVGSMQSLTANFTVSGIGDEWSDYLDDTFFFVSGAMSITDPKNRGAQTGMLGSRDSKTGYSVWAGLQMPSLISEDGRWGLEYNHGSQFWRPITYAEDTNIGSKIAARGNAYEAYFTEPLVEDILSLQVRFTYIDYKYGGSNGFFGNTTGNAVALRDLTPATGAGNYVDKAQDIRFYLRYRY